MVTKNYEENKHSIGIYSITNLINSKRYIGSTKRAFHARKTRHLRLLRNNKHYNSHLQASYNKYGVENFIFEVLETCNLEDVELKEAFYIKHFNSNLKINGYNIKNVTHYRFSYKKDPKHILQASIHKKERSKVNGLFNDERGLQKPINLYDFNGKFIKKYNSGRELNRELGWAIQGISNTLSKRKLKYYNNIILFENDILTPEDILYVNKKYSLRKVAVYDLNNNHIQSFNSIKECAEFLNCKDAEIRMCASNRRSRIRNYITKYIE